ncbi:MAG: S8 family serine peptidase [Bacteroidia bacterium]|nr:S8 family serine peptidase [Bacteroidia bacterium]
MKQLYLSMGIVLFLLLSVESKLQAQIETNNENFESQPNAQFVKGMLYFKVDDYSNIELPDYHSDYPEHYPYLQDLINRAGVHSIYRPFNGLSRKLDKVYRIEFRSYRETIELKNAIAGLPFVEGVYEVLQNNHRACPGTDPLSVDEYHHDLMQICDAWSYSKGEGIVIAVIDDAFYIEHEDLKHSVDTNMSEFNGLPGVDDDGNGYVDDMFGWDFAESDNDVNPTRPDSIWTFYNQAHGTAVTSAAVASYNNGVGVSSVAPGARAMYLKTQGAVPDTTGHNPFLPVKGQHLVDEAISYAINNGADIINMSFGNYFPITTTSNTITKLLLEAADSAGILLVAASGNSHNFYMGSELTALSFPANLPEVIAVGATDQNDRKTSFSNFGFNTDITAPGINIPIANYLTTTSYEEAQGTSLSSPIICGVLALVKAANPGMSKEQIRQCLFKSADDIKITDPIYGWQLGHGRANALLAVQCKTNYSASLTMAKHNSIFCQKDTVTFLPFNDYDNHKVTYEWYLGDGTRLKSDTFLEDFKHVYASPGIYTVTAIIRDSSGVIVNKTTRENWIVIDTCGSEYVQNNHAVWNYGFKASLSFESGKPVSQYGKNHDLSQDQSCHYHSSDYSNYGGYDRDVQLNYLSYSHTPSNDYLTHHSTRYFNKEDGQKSVVCLPYPGATNKHIYVMASNDRYDDTYGLKFTIDTKASSPAPSEYLIGTPATHRNANGEQITAPVITAAAKCDSQSYWIVTHNSEDSPDSVEAKSFVVLELVPSNPDSNKIQYNNTFVSDLYMTNGFLKFSPHASYLGVGRENGDPNLTYEETHVFSFNRTTGAITPFKTYKIGYKYFEFSDNERFIYVYSDSTKSIYQIDMMDNNPLTQRVLIADYINDLKGLQLGPDGRIYVEGAEPEYKMLSYIAYPNQKETGSNECGWMINTLDLNLNNSGTDVRGGYGFPNVVVANKMDLDVTYTATCNDVTLSIDPLQLSCGANVTWYFNGQTQSGANLANVTFTYNEAKEYGLVIKNGGFEYHQTIDLTSRLETTSDVIYPGGTVTLSLSAPNVNPLTSSFQWYRNGKPIAGNTATLTTDIPGEYWLEINGACGHFVSDKVTLKMDCAAPMDQSYTGSSYVFQPGTHYLDSVITPGISNAYHVDGTWLIPAGVSVYVNSTNLIFEEGAEIQVDPNGALIITDTKLSGCGRWKGIRVLGDPSTGTGRTGPVITGHGLFQATECIIQDASCAVLSEEGGVVLVGFTEFGKNHMHVAFTEYNYKHLSSIANSTFANIDAFHQLNDVNYHPGLVDTFNEKVAWVYLDRIDSITLGADTLLYNPYPNEPIDETRSYIGLFSEGNAAGMIQSCIFNQNRFPLSRLDYCSHITFSDALHFSENEFGTDSLSPLAPTFYTPNPVPQPIRHACYFEESTSLLFGLNKINGFSRGLEVYIDNTVSGDTIEVWENEFDYNDYGLVIAPNEFPFYPPPPYPIVTNLSTNSLDIKIRCNRFKGNDIGIGGSGMLINQGGIHSPYDNNWDANIDWDAIWGNGSPGFQNYYWVAPANVSGLLTKLPRYIYASLYDQTNNHWATSPALSNNGTCGPSLEPKNLTSEQNLLPKSRTAFEPEVNVYPNPFNHQIVVSGILPTRVKKVEVIDVTGRAMALDVIHEEDRLILRTTNLPDGVYIVKISTDERVYSHQVVRLK